MDDRNLYLILANYRSAKKDKTKKGEKYFNFKKNMYAYGKPYKVDADGATYGSMILIDEKYIIPANFCRLLTPEERAYVEAEYAKLQSQESSAQSEQEQEEKTEKSDVEKLNSEGQSAMSKTTEKLKNMGLNTINNIKTGYISTGVLFGGIGGVLLAVYLRRSLWVSAGIVVGAMALGGFVGNNFEKRLKKQQEIDKENEI